MNTQKIRTAISMLSIILSIYTLNTGNLIVWLIAFSLAVTVLCMYIANKAVRRYKYNFLLSLALAQNRWEVAKYLAKRMMREL